MPTKKKDTIARAINESKLPAFVVEGVLKEFINEVHIASQKQLEADKKKWNQVSEKENI